MILVVPGSRYNHLKISSVPVTHIFCDTWISICRVLITSTITTTGCMIMIVTHRISWNRVTTAVLTNVNGFSWLVADDTSLSVVNWHYAAGLLIPGIANPPYYRSRRL